MCCVDTARCRWGLRQAAAVTEAALWRTTWFVLLRTTRTWWLAACRLWGLVISPVLGAVITASYPRLNTRNSAEVCVVTGLGATRQHGSTTPPPVLMLPTTARAGERRGRGWSGRALTTTTHQQVGTSSSRRMWLPLRRCTPVRRRSGSRTHLPVDMSVNTLSSVQRPVAARRKRSTRNATATRRHQRTNTQRFLARSSTTRTSHEHSVSRWTVEAAAVVGLTWLIIIPLTRRLLLLLLLIMMISWLYPHPPPSITLPAAHLSTCSRASYLTINCLIY